MSISGDEILCMCVCKTEDEIKNLISSGCDTPRKLSDNFDIGAYCGSCRRRVRILCQENEYEEKENEQKP